MKESSFEKALCLLPFSEENVAIIGSFALWEYQRYYQLGDWMSWKPGDVDVFVTNHDPASFVQLIHDYLQRTGRYGIQLTTTKEISERNMVIDLHLMNDQQSPTISFVRSKEESVADIPAGFDIRICRVMLRVSPTGTRCFQVAPDVQQDIANNVTTIFRDMSSRASYSIKARFRASKYAARGFQVQQGPVYDPTTLAAKPFSYLSDEEQALVSNETPVALYVHAFIKNGSNPASWERVQGAPCKFVGADKSFSVATYNIWADPCGRHERVQSLLDMLVAEQPSVVCLQEVTQEALTQIGLDSRFQDLYLLSDDPNGSESFASRASTGMGIANVTFVHRAIAKVSFRDVVLTSMMRRRALLASFVTGSGKAIVVANVHLESNPERSDVRIEQLAQVKAEMELEMARFDGTCGIICGDINFSPDCEEEQAIPSDWKDCWTADTISKEWKCDCTTASGWMDTWLKQADLGYTSHHGRIDRVFYLTSKNSSKEALQVKETKLLGVGITVKMRNTFVPISDHDGVHVKFLLPP